MTMMDGVVPEEKEENPLYNKIIDACRSVYDPEIPVNIYELGLIYKILIDENGGSEGAKVDIDMTLTSPGCPVAGEMPGWVAHAVESVPGVGAVSICLVWDPPWGLDCLSDTARLELGLL